MGEYSLVFNMLSFSLAAMFAAFAFFVMAQKFVGAKYRSSLMVSSLVVLIAGYHYTVPLLLVELVLVLNLGDDGSLPALMEAKQLAR